MIRLGLLEGRLPAKPARALWGLAIGDAPGTLTEMPSREEISERRGRWPDRLRARAAPPPDRRGMPAGAVTDDTGAGGSPRPPADQGTRA
ncbi:MAG TPA: ADP-ribosylglycohydrolase family protein, partial [Streptosporangiaceae bacterium]|nr:ADP-ribosylglycohydrolase family protein [Streptosporangiaceae bacterium]